MAKRRANGEGSIRKRKDGRWEGRYTAGRDSATGKPIYKNVLGKTQGEVKEKLKKAIADSQHLMMSKAKTYTVGAWIKLWYEVVRRTSPAGENKGILPELHRQPYCSENRQGSTGEIDDHSNSEVLQ